MPQVVALKLYMDLDLHEILDPRAGDFRAVARRRVRECDPYFARSVRAGARGGELTSRGAREIFEGSGDFRAVIGNVWEFSLFRGLRMRYDEQSPERCGVACRYDSQRSRGVEVGIGVMLAKRGR